MTIKRIADWGGFSSWSILPTIMCGRGSNGGWLYAYWLKGRLGVSWRQS